MPVKVHLTQGSISDKIMLAVIQAGEIKRHKLRGFVPSCSINGYYKAYNNLLACQYIEESKHTWKGYGKSSSKTTYVSATAAGKDAYGKVYGKDYVRSISPNISGKLRFDRNSKSMDVNMIFSLCDMAYLPEEKPSLKSYLTTECGKDYIAMSMRHGIAYSSKEIKSMLRQEHFRMGTNTPFDTATGSRFFALLFFKGNAFVIYNTGVKAMLWADTTEKRLRSTLCEMINHSMLCASGLIAHQQENNVRAILLCSRKTGLTSLFLSRGYKKIGNKDASGVQGGKTSITIPILVKNYPSIFLVTLSASAKEQFMYAITSSDKEVRDDFADKITALFPNLAYLSSRSGIAFIDENENMYYAMPCISLREMQLYKTLDKPANFIVPKTTQESISRYLGPIAANFYDADTMEKLPFRHYDKDGKPVI